MNGEGGVGALVEEDVVAVIVVADARPSVIKRAIRCPANEKEKATHKSQRQRPGERNEKRCCNDRSDEPGCLCETDQILMRGWLDDGENLLAVQVMASALISWTRQC